MVMYGCESWTVKKAEHPRIDDFELWCWRRLLRVPWQQGDQASQSQGKLTLNTHWKNWCWSSSILVIWCAQTTCWKSSWCWERLRAEGEEGIRGWDGWMASLMQWTWTWANLGDGEGQGGLLYCSPWVAKSQMWLGDWTTITNKQYKRQVGIECFDQSKGWALLPRSSSLSSSRFQRLELTYKHHCV